MKALPPADVFFIVMSAWMLLIAVQPDSRLLAGSALNAFVVLPWCLGVVVLFATRDPGQFGDMPFYLRIFGDVSQQTFGEAMRNPSFDSGFQFLMWALSRIASQPWFFQGAVAAAVVTAIAIACYKLYPPPRATLAIFVITLFPLFANYVGNTLRQGVAIGLLILALALVVRGTARRWTFAIPLALACVVHASAVVPAAILVAINLGVLSFRVALAAWLSMALLFVTGLNEQLFSGIVRSLNDYQAYGDVATSLLYGRGINRPDFLLVSALLVGASMYGQLRSRGGSREAVFTATIAMNAYFLAFGFIAYSDRLAAYSWFLAPLVFAEVLWSLKATPRWTTFVFLVAPVTAVAVVQGWPAVIDRTPVISG